MVYRYWKMKKEIMVLSEKNRDTFIAQFSKSIYIVKFFLIVMIVYIHSKSLPGFVMHVSSSSFWSEQIKNFITSKVFCMAVPAFFIISGFFLASSKKTYIDLIKRKIKTIVIPYFLINTFWILFFFICSKISFLSEFVGPEYLISNFEELIGAYFVGQPIYYPFWFLKDLFIMSILSIVLLFFCRKIPLIFVGILILIMQGIIPWPDQIVKSSSLVFFSLGCMVAIYFSCVYNFLIIILNRIKIYGVIGLMLVLVFMRTYWATDYLLILYSFVGLVFMIMLSSNISSRLLDECSNYSFFIFCFHEFGEAFLKHAILMVVPISDFSLIAIYVLLPLLVIGGCIILGSLMRKRGPRLYKILCGGR